jgi:glycosyltransferase involved in cell wall biosynthesis
MRILFAHRYFPGHFAHLARALAADPGNQVVFVHAAGQGEIAGVRRLRVRPARQPSSATHHYLQPLERSVLMGQAAYRAAACLSEDGFEPDLVYFHAGFGMGLYLKDAFPTAPSLGLFEWYYRAYGSDADYLGPLSTDDRLRIRTLNAGLLLELDACERGVCPTRFQRAQFPETHQPKLEALHDGIDTELLRPRLGPEPRPAMLARVPSGAELVTYATRGLEPYRGFPQFMQALARLQRGRPGLHAAIAGSAKHFYGGPVPAGHDSWKQAVLAGLPELDLGRVHFLGMLPAEDYRALLRTSEVHVYLTVPFVLSWSLLEAMATACPLVASDTGPVREVVEHGNEGLLADLRDPGAIASQIAALLDDRPRAARLGEAAARRVRGTYGLDVVIPQHLALLRAVAGRGPTVIGT